MLSRMFSQPVIQTNPPSPNTAAPARTVASVSAAPTATGLSIAWTGSSGTGRQFAYWATRPMSPGKARPKSSDWRYLRSRGAQNPPLGTDYRDVFGNAMEGKSGQVLYLRAAYVTTTGLVISYEEFRLTIS